MNRANPKLAVLGAASSLLMPSAALAQGAADEQYRDPFAGQQTGGSQPAPPSPPPAGGTGTGAAPPTAAPAAPAVSVPVGATGQLPRTGLPAFLVAASGVLLLAAGMTLRRSVR